MLDGVDVTDTYSIPLAEATAFIADHSRFTLVTEYDESSLPHTYTFYDCNEGEQTCVVTNMQDIDSGLIDTLPIADSYMFLWKRYEHPPLQAGSTWGASEGILKGGILRPYATIPADIWWYTNDPFEGFRSRAAQIMTHEIINLINSKLEVAPYNCQSLLPDPDTTTAYKSEASRLNKLTTSCYQNYLKINPER